MSEEMMKEETDQRGVKSSFSMLAMRTITQILCLCGLSRKASLLNCSLRTITAAGNLTAIIVDVSAMAAW